MPPGTDSLPHSTVPPKPFAARLRSSEHGLSLALTCAGVHTGEMMGGKALGIAVVIGARVGALARKSEVLVSRTVKDLVAGSISLSRMRGSTN